MHRSAMYVQHLVVCGCWVIEIMSKHCGKRLIIAVCLWDTSTQELWKIFHSVVLALFVLYTHNIIKTSHNQLQALRARNYFIWGVCHKNWYSICIVNIHFTFYLKFLHVITLKPTRISALTAVESTLYTVHNDTQKLMLKMCFGDISAKRYYFASCKFAKHFHSEMSSERH